MEQADTSELTDYLEKPGSVGVLAHIDIPDGKLKGELETQVHISSGTITNRLNEGVELDLLKLKRKSDDHGNAQRYRLTERGRALRRKMEELGMCEAYRQFFKWHQRIETTTDQLQDWVTEEGLDDPRWPPEYSPDDDLPGT